MDRKQKYFASGEVVVSERREPGPGFKDPNLPSWNCEKCSAFGNSNLSQECGMCHASRASAQKKK
jgi:hypothetical protein